MGQSNPAHRGFLLSDLSLDEDTKLWLTAAIIGGAERWQWECVSCSDADVRLLALWAGCVTSNQFTQLARHRVEPHPQTPRDWETYTQAKCQEWAWRRDTALDVLTARHKRKE